MVCALSSISKSEKKETGKMKLLYPLVVFLFVAVSVQSLGSVGAKGKGGLDKVQGGLKKGKDKLHGHVKHKRDLEVVDEDVDDLQEEVLDDVVDPLWVTEEEVAQPESGNGHGRGHGRGKGKGKGKGHHHEHHHGHGKGEGRGRGKGKDKGKKNEVEPVNENEE
ncbi:uncharacterized protein LOC114602375 [Podarcis muralis]